MDASVCSSSFRVHVHNYSFIAIQSFILEVKKNPIIYSGNTRVPFRQALIDFAWARIVSVLLNNNGFFDLEGREYWDRSFRELWKWMRSVLVKDMLARRYKPIYVRSPDHKWLVHMDFLEPYIRLSRDLLKEVDGDSQINPGDHIKVELSQTIVGLQVSNGTVIWLRDSSEPVGSKCMHVSILLQVPTNVSMNFPLKPPEISDLSQLHDGGNQQSIKCLEDRHTFFDQYSSQVCVPSSSTGIQNEEEVQFDEIIKSERNNHQDFISPLPEVSVQTFIDEDFQYIMSLLPRLNELDQRKNAEVKVLMIQALEDAI